MICNILVLVVYHNDSIFLYIVVNEISFTYSESTHNSIHIEWNLNFLVYMGFYGFPCGASGKEPACQCRRRRHKRCRFNPGLGRSPEGRNGNPLLYSCLENPTDRGAWQATYSPWGHKELNTTEGLIHTWSRKPRVFSRCFFSLLCLRCAFPQCLEYAELFYVSESLHMLFSLSKTFFYWLSGGLWIAQLNLPVKLSHCIFCLSS